VSAELRQQLLSLSTIDQEIAIALNRKKDLETSRNKLAEKATLEAKNLSVAEAAYKKAAKAQLDVETKLKEEEQKIITRRKSLSDMGAKASKFGEREVDIASRALSGAEDSVLARMQETEQQLARFESQKRLVDEISNRRAIEDPKTESEISEILGILSARKQERDEIAKKVDPQAMRVYDRVLQRYPAEPVAVVKDNCCQACHRSLPLQLVNQFFTPNAFLTCPGCNRVLVMGTSDEESAGKL
jgi:uncharacterized protein